MTAVHRRDNKILYPPPTFQAVAGRLSCSTSPLAITSPGFSDAPIQADIVFLPDNRVCRKVTYRLYPTSTQEEGLWKRLWLHFILYNGGLQERISAWRHSDRISITFQDQCRSLTENRAFDEGYCRGVEAAEYSQLPLPEGRGLEEKMLTTSDQPGRKAID